MNRGLLLKKNLYLPSEHDEQCVVVQYCHLKNMPCFAIPNGSNKSKTARMSFKREGLEPGIPDLMIPVSTNKFCGLFIEMKRQKSVPSDVKPNQRKWIKILNDNGYLAKVCSGADEAIKLIERYFK